MNYVRRPAPWFQHHEGPWTLEEVLALPEDPSQRVELVQRLGRGAVLPGRRSEGRRAGGDRFEIDGIEYVETARGTGGVLKLERPFPVTIGLSL